MIAPNPPIIIVSNIDFINLLFCIPFVIPINKKANSANPIRVKIETSRKIANGISGIIPINTKKANVVIPLNNGDLLDNSEFPEFLTSFNELYLEIPIENPSAITFDAPKIRAYLFDMFAPKLPPIIATVVITPSIPP